MTAKSNNKRKSSNKKSNSSNSSKTTKRTASRSTSAKSSTTNKSKNKQSKLENRNRASKELDKYNDNKKFNRSVILIVLIVFVAFLYLSYLGLCGSAGIVFTGLMFGIFGWTAYLIPLVSVILYFFILEKGKDPNVKRWIISIILFFIFLKCFLQVITGSASLYDYYSMNKGQHTGFFSALYNSFEDIYDMGRFNGGVICKALVDAFSHILGIIGSAFLCFACMVITIFVGFGKEFLVYLREKNEYEQEMLRMENEINNDDEVPDYKKPDYSLVDIKKKQKRKVTDNNNKDNRKPFRYITIDKTSTENENEIKEVASSETNKTNESKEPVFEHELNEKFGKNNKDNKENNNNNEKKVYGFEIHDSNVKKADDKQSKNPDNDEKSLPDADKGVASSSDNPVKKASNKATPKRKKKEVKSEKSDDEIKAFEENLNKSSEELGKSVEYVYPNTDLLDEIPVAKNTGNNTEIQEMAIKLEETLNSFGVNAVVENVTVGPAVTRFEVKPETGVKVSRITSLTDDIKLSLAVKNIRIEAPIPGKSAVGIEVPNKKSNMVTFRELIENDEFKNAKKGLVFAVGKDIYGKIVIGDISKMPHLLIAGATGSGKSVCINTLIVSLLYKYSPDELKLIMIDPKVVELSIYNGIPHLFCPVVTDAKEAAAALNWGVAEMMKRYNKFKELGVRNIQGYNDKVKKEPKAVEAGYEPMPSLVIIVDEFADLMMVASKEVEDAVCRIAQLARAAGIHLILATQRPSVNVITGVIKANIPSRIAFSTSSAIDSRTILDMAGAERLLGHGDMLYFPAGASEPSRLQGSFLSDEEIERLTGFLKDNNNEPVYDKTVTMVANAPQSDSSDSQEDDRDEYFESCARFVIESERASAGQLQRKFKIGFNRAGRILDQMCEAGIVGPAEGTKPRAVLVTMEELDLMLGNISDSDDTVDEEIDDDMSESDINKDDNNEEIDLGNDIDFDEISEIIEE